MKAYVFPGQGAQYPGMGKDLYDNSEKARTLFEEANGILGFRITDIMFGGTVDDLKQTKVTQPAIFLHSVLLAATMKDFVPDMVAGHSLGEFSALVANKSLTFEDGLTLVSKRAMAMQKACENEPSTMAAVIGMDDKVVEEICNNIDEIVVPANYNTKGQIVISGSTKGIDLAIEKLKEKCARRALKLQVGGAFHSPLMDCAKKKLEEAINSVKFHKAICPIYQNVTAKPSTNQKEIKKNLIAQLTAPVLWTQTIIRMLADNASKFIEVGPGRVLQGLIKKINRKIPTKSAEIN